MKLVNANRLIQYIFGSRQKLNYPQQFLAWSGHLLIVALLLLVVLWFKYLPIDQYNQFLSHLCQMHRYQQAIDQTNNYQLWLYLFFIVPTR
jgi:hypothetical protein